MALYDRIVDKNLLVGRITVAANHLTDEAAARTGKQEDYVRMDLFTDYKALEKQRQKKEVWEKCYLKRHEPGRGRNGNAEK